jgi:hypothetical protein
VAALKVAKPLLASGRAATGERSEQADHRVCRRGARPAARRNRGRMV